MEYVDIAYLTGDPVFLQLQRLGLIDNKRLSYILIRNEYINLRNLKIPQLEAIGALADKYNYSTDQIRTILYDYRMYRTTKRADAAAYIPGYKN